MRKWKKQTSGGFAVRIYADDAGGDQPIHGAVLVDDEWIPERWTDTGRRNKSNRAHDYDLEPDSRTYDTWLQVKDGVTGFMASPVTGAENNIHLRIDVDNQTVEILDWRRAFE